MPAAELGECKMIIPLGLEFRACVHEGGWLQSPPLPSLICEQRQKEIDKTS